MTTFLRIVKERKKPKSFIGICNNYRNGEINLLRIEIIIKLFEDALEQLFECFEHAKWSRAFKDIWKNSENSDCNLSFNSMCKYSRCIKVSSKINKLLWIACNLDKIYEGK